MAKILIVDDSTFARARLKTLFERGGHEVVGAAGDGEEALELFNSLHPELVTLDHVMAGKSGETVLKEIIRQDPGAKVIMISGTDDSAIEERVLQAGAKVFIKKFNAQLDILKVIDRVMEI